MMNSILAVDIGSGAQDVLVYQPGWEIKNNAKMILLLIKKGQNLKT